MVIGGNLPMVYQHSNCHRLAHVQDLSTGWRWQVATCPHAQLVNRLTLIVSEVVHRLMVTGCNLSTTCQHFDCDRLEPVHHLSSCWWWQVGTCQWLVNTHSARLEPVHTCQQVDGDRLEPVNNLSTPTLWQVGICPHLSAGWRWHAQLLYYR